MSLAVFYLLLSNIFLTPLLDFFDFGYFWRRLQQRFITSSLESKGIGTVTTNQRELNLLFEQPEVPFSKMYGNIIKTFFLSCFYFYILPIGPLLCLIYLLIQFWVDKYLILNRYKKHLLLNGDLSMKLAEFAEFALVLLTSGTILFRWRISREVFKMDIAALVISLLVYILPMAGSLSLSLRVRKALRNSGKIGKRRDSLGIEIDDYQEIPFGQVYHLLDVE